ncbi:MAG TPA: DUF4388 domain-containing protein [Thermoanaerobaculia bacterium]|jgi:hypothetical protein
MGISGNLKTMALAELLQWLSQGRKTGTLVIDGKKIKKRIFFEDGVIVSSASTDRKEYLGAFLTSHGFITEEQANAAVARQKEEKKLLGQILVGMGSITEEQLQEVLQLKAEESIYDVFTWDAGEFVFLDDELPAETFIRMHLDVQWIVLEGSRRMDEWLRIREWVPSPLAVPVLVADFEGLEIDEVDKRILEWIDDDRTVEEISQGSQTSLFMIAKILAQYVEQGVIKVVRPRVIEVEVEVEAKDGAKEPAPQQMPQGYPQMMPQMIPMGYPAMPAGYPMHLAGYDPPSGAHPAYAQQQGGGAVNVGGRTLHFAGGAPPGVAAAPPAPPKTEAEGLVQKGDEQLRLGDLQEALDSYRRAKTAAGGGPSVLRAAEEGELRVGEALERDGVKLSSVPKLKCGMEQLTQLKISPQEGFMLTRIDGSYDIRSILKMSPMPKLDAQIFFWKLKKSGHVAF